MFQKIVPFGAGELLTKVFGSYDVNVRLIEKAYGVKIGNCAIDTGAGVSVSGDNSGDVIKGAKAIELLKKMSEYSDFLTEQSVRYVIDMVNDDRAAELENFGADCICITSKGKPIKARTVGQKSYVEAIKNNTVVFGVGPAGTGKTYLAVAMAVKALRERKVSRIILTRPAIEAGEKLGFLPGDLQSKIDPYLRPLYDALYDMMGVENYQKLIEKQVIEIAPLAYMRGRTLEDSFIILDEAQNATPEQMKMFLTRLGNNSRAIITGDLTQTDLPYGQKSGLAMAVKILDGIEDIKVHTFTDRDVVRHKLVQQIILAYDRYERTHPSEATRHARSDGRRYHAVRHADGGHVIKKRDQ
ncbi:MAG: PhoH family protein [Clostridia bacterium]|nr:PhoH family protein [Clostridia bacterium]